MALRLHHTVLLPYPIDRVSHILCNSDQLPKMQELAGCQNCVVTSRATDTPPPVSSEKLKAQLGNIDAPTTIPWPDSGTAEAAHFSFEEVTGLTSAQITGSQFTYHDAVIFRSQVKRFGLEDKKLRVLEKLSETETRVTETVWVTGPVLLMWGLRFTGVAVKVHRKQMDAYGKLYEER